MTKSFKEALKARRTFYQIENKSTLSDKEIRDLIRFAVEFVPSAFNSWYSLSLFHRNNRF